MLEIEEKLYLLNKTVKKKRDYLFNKEYLFVDDEGERSSIASLIEKENKWINICESDLLNCDDWDNHEWGTYGEVKDSIKESKAAIEWLKQIKEKNKEEAESFIKKAYELKDKVLLKLHELGKLEILDAHFFPIGIFTLVRIKGTKYTFHTQSIDAPEQSSFEDLTKISSESTIKEIPENELIASIENYLLE